MSSKQNLRQNYIVNLGRTLSLSLRHFVRYILSSPARLLC